MSTPKIAAKSPAVLELEPGAYWWCACGHSKNQPYCDGSHTTDAPDISPVEFTVEAKKTVALCQCKHTKKPPFCDGSHADL